MRYQPEWIDGRTVGASRRDAEGRYAAIAEHISPQRAFSALDVGAHSGYFSLRLADDFDARVVAVDGAEELREGLGGSRNPNVMGIFEHLTPQSLGKLGAFDVGLCLSVLHHVEWWPQMLDMLVPQCGALFVEVAVPGEDLPGARAHCPEILDAVLDLGGQLVCETPGFDGRFLRPTYLVRGRMAGRRLA